MARHHKMRTVTAILFWSVIIQLGLLSIAIAISAGCIVCRIFALESVFVQVVLSFSVCWLAYKMFFAFTDVFGALLRWLRYKAIQAERRLHAMRMKQIKNDKL